MYSMCGISSCKSHTVHKLEWCLCTGSIPLSITGISSCKSHTVHKLEWCLCTGSIPLSITGDLQLDIPVIDKGILPVHKHHSSLCTVCD
jgi:hypothetical protein